MKTILFFLFAIGVQFPAGKNFTSFFAAGSRHDGEDNISEIPFEFEDGIIVLKASLNSGVNTFDFVLDSGAPTLITSDALTTSSSRLLEAGEMMDITNHTKSANRYMTNDFMVGNRHFGPVEVWSSAEVREMPVLRNRADGGLIGANLMKESIWMIDYQRKKIIITDRLENLSLSDSKCNFPMHLSDTGTPSIKIRWADKKVREAIVDLGCNQSLVMPYKFLNDSVIVQSLPQQKVKALTTGFNSGEKTLSSGTLPFLQVGTMRVENVRAVFLKTNQEMIIGNEFLQNFIVVFDFIHQQLILDPTNDLSAVGERKQGESERVPR